MNDSNSKPLPRGVVATLILLATALLAACSLSATDDEPNVGTAQQALCAPAIGYGDSGPFSFTDSNGFSYDYYVYVPNTYDDCSGEFPLVTIFHGGGQVASVFSGMSHQLDMRAHADTVGAVLIWIDSGTATNQWNARMCCVARDHVLMVDEFVAFTQSMLSIDPGRIHAAGFSNGGMFVQHLASELPSVFASVASVAGTSGIFTPAALPPACWNPYDVACGWSQDTVWGALPPPASDVAVFMIRGSNDWVIPVNGIPLLPIRLLMPAVNNGLMPGETDFELWSGATGCTATAVQTFVGVGDHHLCSGGGRKVRHDIVFNMGHFWPRDDPAGPNFANYDGAQHIAQFLWDNPK